MDTASLPNMQVLQFPNLEPMTYKRECHSIAPCCTAHSNVHKVVVGQICLKHTCKKCSRKEVCVTRVSWTDSPDIDMQQHAHVGSAIQSIHACAMKGLDQALTAGTSVGLPTPAKYVKADCGRANSSCQVRTDKHLRQLLGRKDILGKRSLVSLLLSHSHGGHVHAFHTDRLRSSLWPATRMPRILLRCSICAKLNLR